jgi:hypothetical protein
MEGPSLFGLLPSLITMWPFGKEMSSQALPEKGPGKIL